MPPLDGEAEQAPWTLVGEMGRRRFIQLLGGSLAALGLSSCGRLRPPSEAWPFVASPDSVAPAERQLYATSLPYRGYGRGVVVESVMGRPVKIDGNREHPSSMGGSDAALQAALLDLYDPDRLRMPTRQGVPVTEAEVHLRLAELGQAGWEGVHILTETVTSPWLQATLENLPQGAKWHRFAAFETRMPSAGGFSEALYDLSEVEFVVSFDEDFLGEHPDKLRLARQFGARRDPRAMTPLWVMECTPTLTGAMADRKARVSPERLQKAVQELGEGLEPRELSGLTAMLERSRGRGLVMGGPGTDPRAIYDLNHRFGNLGRSVSYLASPDRHPSSSEDSLAQLTKALESGEVEALLILGGNPVATTGGALDPRKARFSLHLTSGANATSERVEWVVPQSHPLESWGDSRSFEGTAGAIQPLLEPLYPTWTVWRVLSAALGDTRSDLRALRDFWSRRRTSLRQESGWREALEKGVLESTPGPPGSGTGPLRTTIPMPRAALPSLAQKETWIAFRPDPYLDAGESGNNPWLLELPRPFTRLAWSNPAVVSPSWAKARSLEAGDEVEIATRYSRARFPIAILEGQPDNVVTVHTGWGVARGRFATGTDAFALRGPTQVRYLAGEVSATGGHSEPIRLQEHLTTEGRDLVRQATVAQWARDPHLGHEPPEGEALYNREHTSDRRWGMVIDLSKCIGCNACVMACGAENNLPVVGPEQAAMGRAMHWLRVDRYEDEEGAFQPVPCMHCEDAPCEKVCPVEATLHNREGLNQMVYNRCVGTRFCANNCPYKVRRFNYFDYTNSEIPQWAMGRNPEVTVRGRGVMEKCTYCTQRIEAADIRARGERREIADGEVVTACQAACPTRAIVFGDLGDPDSEVSKLAALPHNYGLLAELGTRPRTTYLARLRHEEEMP